MRLTSSGRTVMLRWRRLTGREGQSLPTFMRVRSRRGDRDRQTSRHSDDNDCCDRLSRPGYLGRGWFWRFLFGTGPHRARACRFRAGGSGALQSGSFGRGRARRSQQPLGHCRVRRAGPVLGYVPAYTARNGVWVIDGDAVRWLGVVLAAAGGALRIWPVYVLGRRFSGLVAIQAGHRLVTDGVYGIIRHPSYLGLLINALGWALAFRS